MLHGVHVVPGNLFTKKHHSRGAGVPRQRRHLQLFRRGLEERVGRESSYSRSQRQESARRGTEQGLGEERTVGNKGLRLRTRWTKHDGFRLLDCGSSVLGKVCA